MIRVTCESCGKQLQIADTYAGKKGRCPGCRGPIIIPAADVSQNTQGQQLDQPQSAAMDQATDYQKTEPSPQQAAIQKVEQASPAIWYYSPDGQTYGPFTAAGLVGMIVKGSLASDVLVWRDGLAAWAPANSIPELCQMGLDACPPSLPGKVNPDAMMHRLEHFSVGMLVLLHFVTFGIFTLVWLGLMHGRMPARRSDDPSAGKAIGFMFIPIYSIYWMFFSYGRLCLRLNELRSKLRMAPDVPRGLATAFCVLMLCGIVPYLGILASIASQIIFIVFACIVQSKVNEIAQARHYASSAAA